MSGKYPMSSRACFALFFVAYALMLSACPPSFSGTVTFLSDIETKPAVGLSPVFDNKYVYLVDEDAKLQVYDISKPEEPKRVQQLDAFKDESYQMGFEISSQWLVLLGKSGKITVYDISAPDSPSPLWGNGKVLKLKQTGPMMVRPDSPVMYVTPGNGTAILRVDLGVLSSTDTDQAKLDAATTTIKGGGGGGIIMPFTDENAALRIYVGNKTSGKIDIWDIEKVEKGTADKPINSVDTKAGTNIARLHVYKEKSDSIQGWIVAADADGGLEYFDLDKRYRKADDPASIGSASISGFFYINNSLKLIISDQLDVYDFSKELASPTQFAKSAVASAIIMRALIAHKEYIYTAEAGGFKVYKYAKGASQ